MRLEKKWISKSLEKYISLQNNKKMISDELCKMMGITDDDLSDKDEDWVKEKIREFKNKNDL